MKTLIKVEHLHLGYDNQEVINDLSFDIQQGDFITVLGQNGAGKSTLIKGLLGLIKPMAGQITYYMNEREIGYMPQETKVDRYFPASVYEIVLSGALNRVGYRPFFNNKEKKLAVECLKTLHIENLKNSSFGELSGGQRQALTLMMAVMSEPKLLLLDEHTAALDPKTSAKVMEITKEVVKEKGITTIMVTHNMKHALECGNRLLMMHQWKIIIDFKGKEKKNLTTEKLMEMFSKANALGELSYRSLLTSLA